MRKPSLSVIIITHNEEKNIAACLKSVCWVDEIILVDSNSKDQTVAIAQQFGAKVFQKNFASYGHQKQYALEQATGEWILSLDADERITPELQAEIVEKIAQSDEVVGYEIPFKNFVFGKWVKYAGLFPDYHLRLFRRDAGCFTPSTIHEGIEVNGKVQKCQNPILHFSYPTIASYVEKMNRYTEILARQGYSFRLSHLVFSPLSKFFRLYLARQGFRDGLPGLIYCILAAFYNFAKDAKAWEQTRV